tara:strand:+ start:237 stop:587 length:351 start_codon:yes stop_codon:yes gene_type:complete
MLSNVDSSLLSSTPVVVGGAGSKILRLLLGQEGETVWPFPSSGTSLWDVCAADAILSSVGGKVTDGDGNKIDYLEEGKNFEMREGVVASLCPMVHEECMRVLREIREEEKEKEERG